ncbi:MAG: RloB family protein [Bacilli bacterium]|nr:RloB family protein [Bacilli bacterium]
MTKLRPRGRDSRTSLLNFGRHLVYAEGEKTEPNYVNEIKGLIAKKYQKNPNDIDVIIASEGGKSTIQLFDFAKKDIKKRIKNNETINHVWLFFDKDDFKIDNFKKTIENIEKMNNSEKTNDEGFKYDNKTLISWHACFSNEAFELWYCLYFNYLESQLTRKDYEEILNKKLSPDKYNKNNINNHELLLKHNGKLDNAIKNAKKLFKINGIINPSTKVFEFIEYFKAYMG